MRCSPACGRCSQARSWLRSVTSSIRTRRAPPRAALAACGMPWMARMASTGEQPSSPMKMPSSTRKPNRAMPATTSALEAASDEAQTAYRRPDIASRGLLRNWTTVMPGPVGGPGRDRTDTFAAFKAAPLPVGLQGRADYASQRRRRLVEPRPTFANRRFNRCVIYVAAGNVMRVLPSCP